MLKQIFITSAVLITMMSQMVSSQSDLTTDVPDNVSTQNVKSNVVLTKLFGKPSVAFDEIESNVQETFQFTFWNFLPTPIYVTFSGPSGYYNVTIPADALPVDGNPISFDFQMAEGVYNIYCSTDYNAYSGSVTYGMSCGAGTGTGESATNNYMYSNVSLGPLSPGGCTSLDIW